MNTPTKEHVAALEKLAHDAASGHDSLIYAKKRYIEQQRKLRVDPVITAIEREAVDQFDGPIKAASEMKWKTREDAEAARVALARSDTGWHPVGTKLVHWQIEHWSQRAPTKTGKIGVVEVWSDNSLRALNLASWSTPGAGDIVIRMLKTDGTPSTKFVQAQHPSVRAEWLPEGQVPSKPERVKAVY